MILPGMLLGFLLPAADGPAGPLRVDLNPPNRRSDILTKGWENWALEGAQPSRTFGAIGVTLRSGSPLAVRWYKPLLVHGATMTADGIAAPGSLEMIVTGLSPGRHTLATYHNLLTDGPASRYEISVDGVTKVDGLRPTTKVHNDADAACSYLEIDATGKPVHVSIRSKDGRSEVILNGFEIDTPDPAKKAIKPSPPHDEEHAEADAGSLALAWTSRMPATTHDLYIGNGRADVAAAGRSSPEFRGSLTTASASVENPSSHRDYYWRVDERDGSGQVTPGDVWYFRVRHLAFPGAEGYGRFALGGRGGRVIEVTNLNDSGPGSFRAAVEAEGPRTVVFRMSGVIALRSAITIAHPYLTIAGQTAPGEGICFRGCPVGTSGSSSDIIIRFIRVRVGDEAGRSFDGMGLAGDHTIFDHCSISWSIDEGLDSRSARNSTFERCMISEALDASFQQHPHAFAASIGGNMVSYHHNLLAHCTGRNWSLAGGYDNAVRFAGHMDIRNNVVYNWRHRTTDGGAKRVNFVNNYYKPGPATQLFLLMRPDVGSPTDRQTYHIAGNIMEGHPEFDLDNWKGVVPSGNAPLDEIKVDAPLFPAFVTTTSAADAFRDVLADVGATLPRQDTIDRRIIEEVRAGSFTFRGSKGGLPGIIDSQCDLGPNPWPEYKTFDVPDDCDHDGLPDAWERKHGLNPNSPPNDFSDSNADPDGDGYTHLEDYLNELAAGRRQAQD
jgi:hypothetical protein